MVDCIEVPLCKESELGVPDPFCTRGRGLEHFHDQLVLQEFYLVNSILFVARVTI